MSNLTVKQLSSLVESMIQEERAVARMQSEIKRVLGPSIIAEGSMLDIAKEANKYIDVLEHTGKIKRLQSVDQSVVNEWLASNISEVRRLAARFADEKILKRLSSDKHHSVRSVVAKQAPLSVVHEMCKKFPSDDNISYIYENRKLNEDGVPTPKKRDQHLHMYDKKPIGPSAKTGPTPELSDNWYHTLASKLVMDYNNVVDRGWSASVAHRWASSKKATAGVEIDEVKLKDAIDKILQDKDDRTLERSVTKMRESVEYDNNEEEEVEEQFDIEDQDEVVDEMTELFNKRRSAEFISEVKRLFSIKESSVPQALLNSSSDRQALSEVTVPFIGKTANGSFRAIDEKVLDVFCESWNNRQSYNDEPLTLSWHVHSSGSGRIGFSVKLR
jgi:hypothetical protein